MSENEKKIKELIENQEAKMSTEGFRSFVRKIASISSSSLTTSVIGHSTGSSAIVVGDRQSENDGKVIDQSGQWKVLRPSHSDR